MCIRWLILSFLFTNMSILFVMDCFLHFSEDGKEATNSEAPENNPQYTTVYVGNLAPEVMRFLCFFFTCFPLIYSSLLTPKGNVIIYILTLVTSCCLKLGWLLKLK